MVEFKTGYYHAMDKEYWQSGLSPGQIGLSAPPMENQLEALKARIFQGVGKVELGFTGVGKGSMGGKSTTPEMYGKDEREAIRELATINKVELTTHATVGIAGLAGLADEGFSDAAKESAINEIKRAVDFAADTAGGGPIVFHASEFPRPIAEKFGNDFAAYPLETEKAVMHLVDTRDGRVVSSVRKDQKVILPDFKVLKDTSGNEVFDEFGLPVYEKDEQGNPIPEFDYQTKRFKTKEYGWDYFEKASRKWNAGHADQQKTPEEMFFNDIYDSKERQAKGWAFNYTQRYDKLEEDREKAKKILSYYEKLEAAAKTPEEKERLMQLAPSSEELEGIVPPEVVNKTDYLRERLAYTDRQLEQIREAASSYEQQVREIQLIRDNIKPIKEFALDRSRNSLARAAIYAWDVEKEKGCSKPLFIAPENLFPEQYGSNPQELKELVVGSRKQMVELLTNEKINGKPNPMWKPDIGRDEAERIAQEHIKATFDIGHAYIWRKYFLAKAGESSADTDKRFNKWLMNEIDGLNKEKVIGHIHISDNFGYHDEHVTPGMGKAPIKEFIEKMKKAGVTDVIVEPAHQDYHALLGAWRESGHSVYGLPMPGVRPETWADIEHSYFGSVAPPYFLFGTMAPSDEYRGAPFWSGLGLE